MPVCSLAARFDLPTTLFSIHIYGPNSSAAASSAFYFRALLPMFAIVWAADNGHYKFIRQSLLALPRPVLTGPALQNVSEAVAVAVAVSERCF